MYHMHMYMIMNEMKDIDIAIAFMRHRTIAKAAARRANESPRGGRAILVDAVDD